jgi:hypothetical protein
MLSLERIQLSLKTKCISCLTSAQHVTTSRPNSVKRTIIVQFVIGLLLLLFPINYSVFAQTGELSGEEQTEDIIDFAGLATSIGPASINGAGSDQASSSGRGEVDLTTADFSPIRDGIATAREAIQNNDSTVAYNALNSADNFLFGVSNEITSEGGERNSTELIRQLNSLQTHIDAARDALVNRDNIKTMEEINALDIGLFSITPKLETED